MFSIRRKYLELVPHIPLLKELDNSGAACQL